MKHVNGDMDDLFRRASEKYPLRTDSADWDKLAAALDQAPAPASDSKAGDERRKRRVFWWFLLLPLGGLGYFALQPFTPGRPATPSAAIHNSATGADSAAGSATGAGSAAGAAGNGAAVSADAVSTAGSRASADAGSPVPSGAATPATTTRSATITGTPATTGTPAAGTKTAPNGGVVVPAGSAASTGPAAPTGFVSAYTPKNKHHRTTAAPGLTGKGNDQGGTATTQQTFASSVPRNASINLHRVPTAGDYHLLVDVKAPAAAVDSSNSSNRKKATAAAKKSSHAYVGLFGSPDLSTVKFQDTKGVGTTFGVILGYAFNNHWAVESGVYLDRKRYYTNGSYFSKGVVNTYPGTNLLNVDGTCYMWEIPLNLRYNFNTSERMKWFATAGLSTYLMSHENYSYQFQYAGGGSVEDGTWNLKKPSQYWFSIVNVSAGFEQRLGKIGNLRLEPYLRIPLSGIGTGRLPIMSAGLNIGITRQLW